MIVKSRVTDARKPITSYSGAHRAIKARSTLQTAQAILRASGLDNLATAQIGLIVDLFSDEISAWYRSAER